MHYIQGACQKHPKVGGMPKIRGWRLHLPKKWGGETNLEKFLGMDKEDPKMGEGGGDGRIQKWGDELQAFFCGGRVLLCLTKFEKKHEMGGQNLFEINWSTACKKYGGCKHLTLEFFSGWRHKGSEMGRVQTYDTKTVENCNPSLRVFLARSLICQKPVKYMVNNLQKSVTYSNG